jgi:hypothetical protein
MPAPLEVPALQDGGEASPMGPRVSKPAAANRQSMNRQSTSGGGGHRASSGGYQPPLWSAQFGNSHGQWSARQSLDILGGVVQEGGETITVSNAELIECEKRLRECIYSRIDPFKCVGFKILLACLASRDIVACAVQRWRDSETARAAGARG